MRTILSLFRVLAVLASASYAVPLPADDQHPPASPPPSSPVSPAHPVATLLQIWHDAARNRDVPVKIYYPADTKSPCPLIIFSHGLGGNREGYAYLGQGWAGAGFIVIHVQHLGSDDAVWRGAGADAYEKLTQAVADTRNALNRAADVKFAITQMLDLVTRPRFPLKGLVDPSEIGMAGHSFGAWTTLAVTGQKLPNGLTLTDPRIKAAIAMSAPVPGGALRSAGEFASIPIPVFHMTGTRDNSPIGETAAPDRRIPFDQSKTPGTCLLILNGADHMAFSGHILNAYHDEDARYQAIILKASITFWNANLLHNAADSAWLYKGGFAKELGAQGTFETR